MLTGAATADPRPLVRVGTAESHARHGRGDRGVCRRRRTRARPTSCSTTSWASATAFAGCGATSAAGWARISDQHRRRREETTGPRFARTPDVGPHSGPRTAGRSGCVALARRHRVPRQTAASHRVRRECHVPEADGPEGICRPTSPPQVKTIDYSSATVKINVALDRNRRSSKAVFPTPARRKSRPAAPRDDARLPDDGLHRRRVRRRPGRPVGAPTRCSMHNGDGLGRHFGPAREAHFKPVRPVRPVPPGRTTWAAEAGPFATAASKSSTSTPRGSPPASSTGWSSRRRRWSGGGASPAATSCRGR